ncbi:MULTISPECIES: cell wall metabolism sensor histidine kinase WalK [Streptomyces]|uniref:histidine kinase n=1 Tax=Streptomyces glycanivorans TaxID=3033808 RepID=A0ABY9J8U3_9ACTN|nr:MULTISPECIES: HAMP domain-containing sensor histidine kinase [unclassified Streptomyces]WSQ75909.1 HAMP domain-containing histidine kinase [Streptomyces sp. NBC_01213]TXS12438.1 sensor histidine kinase [Streptomyces sp. wa22]WLQ62401.1 HAMP domain-containing sensor histidine kinase [Streptomyces sp. Alt3]WSQ83156.1 HAMP domain-containing histidine kinase [Streptomyces sp. NBC_01212]WSR10814.1 HAMP domain-containing histidine kinase [Streptomyces sp. NBC_01208]
MPRRAEKGGQRLRLPLRKSLLGRLLAVSALVAACSVAATAWLAVQTTSGAIEQEQGRNLAADTRVLDTLLAYAARHPTWDGVGPTVDELADTSDRRITLTTQSRQILADSADSSPPPPVLPPQASAVVDPLSVADVSSVSDSGSGSVTIAAPGTDGAQRSGTDRVDPRAVGPFELSEAERTSLRRTADEAVQCLSRSGIASDVVEGPSGRPRIQVVGNDPDRLSGSRCSTDVLDRPTGSEAKALVALNELVNACLDRQGREPVDLDLDLSWRTGDEAVPATAVPLPTPEPSIAVPREAVPTEVATPAPLDSENDRDIASCVGIARQEQLSSYVASPALLFISDPGGGEVPGFDLSPGNTAKITGVAALVLALTVGASVLAGVRLVRPLHALTGAAQRMRDGEAPSQVVVAADNEIGRLATAFNDMSAHRARMEEQRKVMVSDVAHELRTPLSNIRGWLEGAQDGIADADATFVSSLLEEAVQLQHIIDDLQDLSAADAGALRLHPEPVRVEELLAHVVAAHQAQADAAGVSLTVTVPEGHGPVPEVEADPVRLRQAIGNLVSNAVRHTPAGGRVTLRALATGPGGPDDGVLLEVADTGSGIAQEDLPYVFDRFWRAEKSRSRRTGGSGLGLAIVRKLVEAHGGTAGVVSTVGQGSVFTLRLPCSGPDPMNTAV